MFGKNPVHKSFERVDGSLLVHSIWPTIQGEGPDAGIPAVFIRLSRCNLRCYFCDTDFSDGIWMSVDEIVTQVSDLRGKTELVVITGGEPLLQNIVPLVHMLNKFNLRVSIETAGTVYVDGMDALFERPSINLIVCSPKTPTLNKDLRRLIHSYKYIIAEDKFDMGDGLPIHSTQNIGKFQRIARPPQDALVFVQPMDVGNSEQNEVNARLTAAIAMKHGYRLSVQIHKIVGVD